jgi:hypothetical protein
MQHREFIESTSSEEAARPDPSLTIGDLDGACTVDGLYPLPLDCVASSYARGTVFTVEDNVGSQLGYLLTCRGTPFNLTAFSAPYLAAYLSEVSKENYGLPGQFARDYVLVRTDCLPEYRASLMGSSAVWGGFLHPSRAAGAPPPPKPTPPIVAQPGIVLSTELHAETAMRSVFQPYAFERFLKLYHLLELDFDHVVVEKIRALGDDLMGIGQLLSSYDSKELDRLKQTISDRCNDVPAVATCLAEICSNPRWHGTMKRIFFDFGKGGNPFDEKWDEFYSMLLSTGFTQDGAATQGFIRKGAKTPHQDKDFGKLVIHVSAYWIYRVRSSVAHSKIGEYVMRLEDEDFVEQFAERLIRRVLGTVLHR